MISLYDSALFQSNFDMVSEIRHNICYAVMSADMIPNHSPWIKQLNRTRPIISLNEHIEREIAIIGGGIAGVVTAFFTLRDTNYNVALFEADKVAHGATGHNAGLLTSYFERPLSELAKEFGDTLAIEGQRAIESSWNLLDTIIAEASLQTPLYRFTGYTGLSSYEQVLRHFRDNALRIRGGLPAESVVIAKEAEFLSEIPSEYAELYAIASRDDIRNLLETHNHDYVAALTHQEGCMNSALFTEELAGYLIATYPERFVLYEGSPVRTILLQDDAVELLVGEYAAKAHRAILCTNGFEHFSVINEVGPEIDTKFHHSIAGRIGYMSGYIEPLYQPPVAISYFPKENKETSDPTGESYYYLTRRPHEYEGNESYNLICAGGPEKVLPNGADYSRAEHCSEDMRNMIDDFVRDSYVNYPGDRAEYAFCWHGLMGYTPSGVRLIGLEPLHSALLYNLGCNGVGILPSIYGGKKILEHLAGNTVAHSIFDPRRQYDIAS